MDDITADAGIRVRGSSLEEVVCKAILATFNEITDIERVQEREEVEVEAEAPLPFLLADLINRALVVHESRRFVAKSCKVIELEEGRVKVRLKGETFDPNRHTSKLVIKAATYHRIRVERKNGEYEAEVIFDI